MARTGGRRLMEVLSSRILLRPRNLTRSLHFYQEQLGLAVFREFGSGDHRGVVFFTGGGLLEVSGSASGHQRQPGDLGLWLQVRDAASEIERLEEAGVEVIREARREPWGLIEAWIEDPDGLRICVVQVPEDHPLRRRD